MKYFLNAQGLRAKTCIFLNFAVIDITQDRKANPKYREMKLYSTRKPLAKRIFNMGKSLSNHLIMEFKVISV